MPQHVDVCPMCAHRAHILRLRSRINVIGEPPVMKRRLVIPRKVNSPGLPGPRLNSVCGIPFRRKPAPAAASAQSPIGERPLHDVHGRGRVRQRRCAGSNRARRMDLGGPVRFESIAAFDPPQPHMGAPLGGGGGSASRRKPRRPARPTKRETAAQVRTVRPKRLA
jgi:hypothetical protein